MRTSYPTNRDLIDAGARAYQREREGDDPLAYWRRRIADGDLSPRERVFVRRYLARYGVTLPEDQGLTPPAGFRAEGHAERREIPERDAGDGDPYNPRLT